MASYYCIETNEYAVIEDGCVVDRGEIQQIGAGGYWFFVIDGKPGTLAPQVCEGFGRRGATLLGDHAPETTASRVYKTQRGFEKAVGSFAAMVS